MEDSECESLIHVWAVATNGEALFRHGVSESCPMVNFNIILELFKKNFFKFFYFTFYF